tara:strand:+ start:1392 stop:1841 length:450 start_codon:yes stop_codon:yes gene_type:complete
MPVRSFRGKIADGTTDIINLHTRTGDIGYRIVKFNIMHAEPGQQTAEHTVKIYKVDPSTGPSWVPDNAVDFSDNTLLGAAYLAEHHMETYPLVSVQIFDNEVFNQDIYVTHSDTEGTQPCNYYIELEMIRLDLNENTVATLKDIRNTTQ